MDIEEERIRAALRLPRSTSTLQPVSRHGRHRFVRDGEVPVTVVNPRHGHAAPDREIMAELERALAAERHGRSAAEKALDQARETIRQLQTRLAHAEMAQREVAHQPVEQATHSEPTKSAKAPRRRSPEQAEDEVVEWWKPGWRERFRERRQETSPERS